MRKKLAKNLVTGDRLRGGTRIMGPAVSRRVPLNRDAIGRDEVGFPVEYPDGGQAVRIFKANVEVEVQ